MKTRNFHFEWNVNAKESFFIFVLFVLLGKFRIFRNKFCFWWKKRKTKCKNGKFCGKVSNCAKQQQKRYQWIAFVHFLLFYFFSRLNFFALAACLFARRAVWFVQVWVGPTYFVLSVKKKKIFRFVLPFKIMNFRLCGHSWCQNF